MYGWYGGTRRWWDSRRNKWTKSIEDGEFSSWLGCGGLKGQDEGSGLADLDVGGVGSLGR